MHDRANVTPQAVNDFANLLKAFNQRVGEDAKRLNAQFKNLEGQWDDKVHTRFTKEFEETMKVIRKFVKHSDQHIPFLRKKAGQGETYLNR